MSQHIGYDELQSWLDEDHPVIDEVEQVPESDAAYHFAVRTDNVLINLMKRDREGPLILGAEATLEEEHITAVRESSHEFFPQIEAVLTNGPGVYAFTDGQGNPVDFDDLQAVMIRHWIYPDAASQNTVMTAIVDIVSALLYVQGTIHRILSNIDSAD